MIDGIKDWLRQIGAARAMNSWWKGRRTREQYIDLCAHYGSACVFDETGLWPMSISEGANDVDEYTWRPTVLYVGADWDQDSAGLLQGLRQVADVFLFEGKPGRYGQLSSREHKDILSLRRRNGAALTTQFDRLSIARKVDLVIGQMWAFTMEPSALAAIRRRGARVVNIAMDDRHAFRGWTLENGEHAGTCGLAGVLDLACTAAPECVTWYEKEGCRAMFLPEGSDPSLFRPLETNKEIEVVFVGANYGIRQEMVTSLRRIGIAVEAFGTGWPNGRLSTDDMPRIFSSSKIVLGCGTVGHCKDFYALKLRDFDGPMSGSLYITHDNPDLRGLYDIGREIVTFNSTSEMVDKVVYYISHDAEREEIAAAGRTRAANAHTWAQRFRYLLAKVSYASRGDSNNEGSGIAKS
jgi:hypothetical protein